MRLLIILFFTGLTVLSARAQKFVSQESSITFFSDAVVEDIKAVNKAGVSLIDFGNKSIVFIVKVREFDFEKALMQEHFKEKYIEAERYPKADFKGKFEGFDPGVTGDQDVKAEGLLTIHGATNNVAARGIMRREGNLIYLKSQFRIKLKDYNITIPQVLWQNIAEDILITIDFIYRPYEKN